MFGDVKAFLDKQDPLAIKSAVCFPCIGFAWNMHFLKSLKSVCVTNLGPGQAFEICLSSNV